ncbi:SCO2322 family protein [Streptomyces sp. NPDC058855]|uniref:SCO2322 family protein n=1 Tax=Streptomyces sp. NPDC058855 TaxID=3346651 RepID=UPI00369B4093
MTTVRLRSRGRTRVRVAGASAGALLALAAAAPSAEAAGYRYWSFWEAGAGQWTYATQGPATARPADGSAIGFRFALSADSADAARPSTAPDAARICGDVPGRQGTKRVAVVVDFGGPKDAPPGETPPRDVLRTGCAQVPESATAADALAAVVKPLRYNSAALLCGIAGYPAKGCGEQVADAPPAASAAPVPASGETGTASAPPGGGPSLGVLVGGAAVLALGGAAVWKARRRG